MVFGKSSYSLLLAVIALIQVVLAQEYAIKTAQKSKNGIITLTDTNFPNVFEGTSSRDFGIVVLFTTENIDFGCTTCTKFDPEYEMISNSWAQDHPNFASKENPDVQLIFAKASIESPKQIPNLFKMFKLQQIPKLLYFPPGKELTEFETVDIPPEEGMERVNHVMSWLKSATGIKDFYIHEPTDWTSFFLSVFIAFSVVYLSRKHSNIVLAVIGSKYIWTLGSVIFIIFMISGYMFTKMRHVPIAGSSRNGEIIYFAEKEFQNQFGIETQIVAVMYGILGFLMIFLIKIVPSFDSVDENTNNKTNKKPNKKGGIANSPYLSYILSLVGAIALYSFFAAYTNIYGLKQAYPFTFFKITKLLGL